MYDYHPVLSHFPIVLLVVCQLTIVVAIFLNDKFKLFAEMVVTFLVVSGAIFSVLSFVSGYFSLGYLELHPESAFSENIYFHHNIARLGMILTILAALIRIVLVVATQHIALLRYTFFCITLMATLILSYAGYLGARLVFIDSVGVSCSDCLTEH